MITPGILPEAAQHYVELIKAENNNRNHLRHQIIELEQQLSESKFHIVTTAALDAVLADVETESLTSLSQSELAAIRTEIFRQIGKNILSQGLLS